jgi:hypothetical protein
MIAMLRVGWTVAGWAPGVWRTWSSVRFHSMTWWGWVGLGVPGQRCFVGGCASAAAVKETLAASKASVAAIRLICFGSSFVGRGAPRGSSDYSAWSRPGAWRAIYYDISYYGASCDARPTCREAP